MIIDPPTQPFRAVHPAALAPRDILSARRIALAAVAVLLGLLLLVVIASAMRPPADPAADVPGTCTVQYSDDSSAARYACQWDDGDSYRSRWERTR